MSIVPLKKITLCGFSEEAEKITNKLQNLGIIHVINQNHQSSTEEAPFVSKINENFKDLQYLANARDKLHMLKEDENFNPEELIAEISSMRAKTEELLEELEIVEKKIESIEPWGDFEFIPKEEIENHKFWFYEIPIYNLRKMPKNCIYFIASKQNANAYTIVLSEEEPDDIPGKNIQFGHRSLKDLENERDYINEQIDEIRTRRIILTKYRYLLAESLNDINNEALRFEIESYSQDDGELFILKGYINNSDVKLIKNISYENAIACYIEDIKENEKAPTLLKNKEALSGGEELVKFYSVPAYGTLDPSNALFFFFALFFAMIMSDFGYACVLGLILALSNGKLKKSKSGRRVRSLSWFTVIISMIWGVLIGSYFGAEPTGNNIIADLARKFKTVDMNNINAMMKVSIYIGVVHVCIANLIRAWRHRKSLFALSRLGWAFVTISGIMYIPMIMMGEKINNIFGTIAPNLLTGGLIMVFLFSSESKNIFKRIIDGLLGLTKISTAFGDVLSYLRIFALGLASASLGITFNQLSIQVIDAMPTLGYVMAFIILILGHAINFGLGIMSGVVHGLRLNVIEFFNWSISDEGYPFNAFKKMEVKKWIKL
ncbi:MAG: hypothetical protein N4A43_02000 [Alphaproteobacteria bacterium]|jgi:V/A-type H+-transporting ATPase subunit I|nr:hypothetical protein [Alphaproteobacteria bacterium]